jgi:sterol desaturase/sphingolipid hydroxylase (fatty acid hydroxylase superfamily)
MFSESQNIQVIAFFLLAGLFEMLERLRPARELDRWKEIKTDVFSFAVAIFLNQFCSFIINAFFTGIITVRILAGIRTLQSLPGFIKIILAICIVDFCLYWIHRSQHHFNTLWKTHQWHHSVEHLYWFSGFRTSFFHSLMYTIPQAAIPMIVFHLSPLQAGIGYSIGLFIQFWEHTNINVNVGRLKWLIITPAYHRVHHSASELCRKNLGTTFSLWDRMFGTYIDPASVRADLPLGLEKSDKTRKDVAKMAIGI